MQAEQQTRAAVFKCDDFAYSREAMLEANPDDEELTAWIRGAKVGDELKIGGGAAPLMTVKRLS